MADRLRPQHLDQVCGQGHLLAPGRPLYAAVAAGHLHSMILWGPPGTGKTTLARLLAASGAVEFVAISAVLAGVKDIRAAVEGARQRLRLDGRRTLVFVDEVHRFNKAQQDAFLPHIEEGTILFVGATTENPSFEVNNALLSRVRTYVLRPLQVDDLDRLLRRALNDVEHGLGRRHLEIEDAARGLLLQAADGDARRLLTLLEIAADLAPDAACLEVTGIREVIAGGDTRRFDKGGEAFYDQISALHKAVRGSHPDAALYWLARMLDGGCDPRYLARRLARIASEDIGNADPRALSLALDAWSVQERLGSPEGELALAQAVAYLASVPKSNAVYSAYKAAMADARRHGSLEVPMHLRNAPTRLMQGLGYGRDYRYAHDEISAVDGAYAAGERYLPEGLPADTRYYHPTDQGLEARISERLARLRALDRRRGGPGDQP